MNPELQEQLDNILSAVRVVSPDQVTISGRPLDKHTATAAMGFGTPSNSVVAQLQAWLYQRCYCSLFQPGIENGTASFQEIEDSHNGFLMRLSEANASRQRLDSGWQITRIETSGQIWAQKGNFNRVFWPGEFVNYGGPGAPPRAGEIVSAFVAKESTTLQPGYYFAFGETLLGNEDFDFVRFYWNVSEAGASPLLKLLSRDLNRYQIPFRFKCPVRSVLFHRRDAAVLYVNKRFYLITRDLLEDWANSVAEYVRAGTPLFTLEVGRGIGVAEDPGTGESFGSNRCRLLAEAIWSAYTKDLQTNLRRLEEVREYFHKTGLDLDRPYLNSGSFDQYGSTGLN